MMRLTVVVFALSAVLPHNVDPAMVGHWTGTGKIFVNWTNQRELPVDLTIREDGTVLGRVGDARLVDGRFHANRGWVGRTLHLKTDWIIDAKLDGPIVAVDSIVRERV